MRNTAPGLIIVAVHLALLSGAMIPGNVQALVTFNGSGGVDSRILTNGGCAGCHGTSTAAACTGTAVQTAWLDSDSAAERRTTTNSCYADIADKISASPSYGVRMPQGGPYFNAADLSLFTQWNTDGRLLHAAPTVTTQAATAVDNDSATLRSATAANGATATVNYRYALNAALSSSPVTTASTNIGSGGGTGTSAANRGISNLLCGTTYFYRAQGNNSQGTTNGTVLNFTTSACSNPVISFSGQGSGAGNRISVSKNLNFTEADLTISATDADVGSLSWSFGTPSAGTISGVNSSTGAFTYNAPATAGNATFTITVTDTDPAGGGGPNSDIVTVYVSVADNAPQFRSAAFPGGVVITSDSLTVNEGDGSTPSQSISMFAYDADIADTITWSVSVNPAQGSLNSLTSATGTTNSITYTPNNDVDTNDAFTIQVTDGTTNVNLPITANVTPVADNPFAVADGPFVFDVNTAVLVSVLGNDGDVDTGNTINVDAAGFSGVTAGASVSVVGNQIRYTPAAGQVTNDSFQYRVIDNTGRTSNSVTVNMSPRDTDSDGIINYLDNCAATANAAQTDTDGDQVINVNTTMDPGGNIGGDACDLDDDGDTISDADEIANSLDPLDSSDALLDNDGDGVSNLDEINAGTNPNLANLIIDASGYLTPYNLPAPDPQTIHRLATSVTISNPGPYRPGVNDITWTPSNAGSADLAASDAANLISNPPIQPFHIRPLLNFSAAQVVEEGTLATVELTLNGAAPAYPVTVDYSIGGTATAGVDYTAPAPVSGSVVFNNTNPQQITFNVTGGDGADANETVILSLDSATNAALGSSRSHTVTLIEGNVAPQVSITFTQGGTVGSAYSLDGNIGISAVVSDANAGQTHSFDWSGSDNSLTAPGNLAAWTAFTPPAVGNYVIDLVVTDDGAPAASTRVTRILNVTAGNAPQGADDDNDGVPNNVDPHDASANSSNLNLIPDQTVDMASSLVVQTDPGLKIATGVTAQAANRFGVLITDSDVAGVGSSIGGAPANGDDSFRHFGGVYSFSISGLDAGANAHVVIPLKSAIPRNAEYRKFNPASGWGRFVEDANNAIFSAAGAPGACPEPGSSLYSGGLRYLDYCVQLVIQDGGPNDTDNLANGIINDPGAIGSQLTDPVASEVEEGGGRMSPMLLLMMALFSAFAAWRRPGVFGRDPAQRPV